MVSFQLKRSSWGSCAFGIARSNGNHFFSFHYFDILIFRQKIGVLMNDKVYIL